MPYHDNATCGSCNGKLEAHRDVICETCYPATWWDVIDAAIETMNPTDLATEEREMGIEIPEYGMIETVTGTPPDGVWCVRLNPGTSFTLARVQGEMTFILGPSSESRWCSTSCVAEYFAPPLEPLPSPAVEKVEMTAWPVVARWIENGVAIRAVRLWPNHTSQWSTDEFDGIDGYYICGDDDIPADAELCEQSESEATIQRLTRERDEFQSQRDQAEAKLRNCREHRRAHIISVDALHGMKKIADDAIQAIQAPSTPSGGTE